MSLFGLQDAIVLTMRPAGRIPVAPGALGVVLAAALTLGAVAGGGCGRRATPEGSRRQLAESFGQLPGLRETPDPRLQAELARIVEEKATPALLSRCEIPDDENVATGLAGLFAESEIESISKRSSDLFPHGEFRFDPGRLQRAIRFRQGYEAQRQAARQALHRPGCCLHVQYRAGFAADLSLIDVVRVCARLEAFHAAESLARDDVAAAIDSLGCMFRLAACLAAEKHPTARLQGALLREEALAVLQAIVEHPELSRPAVTGEQLARLYTLVEKQLEAWPPDADAWIGDRALGMHAYELVRAGRLSELLTEEEIVQFAAEGILDDLPAEAQRNVNGDEAFYLEAMRKIIEGCRRPYYRRTEVFASIREDLHGDRTSPDFPLVAGRLLLVDIRKGHALQARDRARCEPWALALAAAAGLKPPEYRISPLSGQPYKVLREDGLVSASDVPSEEYIGLPPIVVPDLAGHRPEQ
jgi:hypothetical protein